MRDTAGAGDPLGVARAAKPVIFDVSKPHSARIYDYFLGGKDNFAADISAENCSLICHTLLADSTSRRNSSASSTPA